MTNRELVALYEITRERARIMHTWKLRWSARRGRRSLRLDPGDEVRQVRLVALEQEMRTRGFVVTPGFPAQPFGNGSY